MDAETTAEWGEDGSFEGIYFRVCIYRFEPEREPECDAGTTGVGSARSGMGAVVQAGDSFASSVEAVAEWDIFAIAFQL